MSAKWALLVCGCFLLGAALASAGDPDPKQNAEGEKPKRPQERPKSFEPAQLLEKHDKNKDGYLDLSEAPEPLKQRFERIDANKDDKLSREELAKVADRLGQQPPNRRGAAAPDPLFRLLDTNSDDKLSREELQNAAKVLEKLDKNKDGTLDREELASPPTKRKRAGRLGEVITPAAKGERPADRLKVGDPAPDFTLPLVNGNNDVTLAAFQGKKPVVLIFASYT